MSMKQWQLDKQNRDKARADEADRIENTLGLGGAPNFGTIFRSRPGGIRRRALAALFAKYPRAVLPVNRRHQANTDDPDLRVLLKKGVLKRVRWVSTSRTRQTYLVLASSTEYVKA